MSEQTKTLKELAEHIGWCAYGPGTEEGTPERQANVEGAVLSVMRNYHLIPGADAVVTEKGLEAACEAVMGKLGYIGPWSELASLHRGRVKAVTRTALEAAGITVTKEVRIVFDGPPCHESGRFIEVETPDGKSVSVGEWCERVDGLWELRLQIAQVTNPHPKLTWPSVREFYEGGVSLGKGKKKVIQHRGFVESPPPVKNVQKPKPSSQPLED